MYEIQQLVSAVICYIYVKIVYKSFSCDASGVGWVND